MQLSIPIVGLRQREVINVTSGPQLHVSQVSILSSSNGLWHTLHWMLSVREKERVHKEGFKTSHIQNISIGFV